MSNADDGKRIPKYYYHMVHLSEKLRAWWRGWNHYDDVWRRYK